MTKHYYKQKQKQKQKQDKNYTKRKRQPKLQGNNTTNKHTRQMTAAGKKSQSCACRKPKLKEDIKSSSQWGCKKRSIRGRWVAEHAKEIGGTLKWRGKFE
jgi:hypothetical protein